MDSSTLHDIGTYRAVRFRAGRIDLVQADFDLLVVGMPAVGCAMQDYGTPCQPDQTLIATLSQLRAGGVFDGVFGETLVLDRLLPPVRARALLVIGLGDPALAGPAEFEQLAAIATRAAQKLRHRSVGGLVTLGRDAPVDVVAPVAAAIMTGALRTMGSQPAVTRCLSQVCTFDLGTPRAERAVEAMRRVLAETSC